MSTRRAGGPRLSVVVGALVDDDHVVLERSYTPTSRPADAHRPGGGEAADPELGLDVVEQAQRVFADPVALVDEGEDREAAACRR
jgi:hypothetical protein